MSHSSFLGLALAGLVASTSFMLPSPPLRAGTRSGLAAARPAVPAADTLLDSLKIVVIGSSVPYGQGATDKYGYVARYATQLAKYTGQGNYPAWKVANISVPGDNTVKVLARWQRDLLPQRGRYVVLALSLGNEGIHERGQPMFDQFRDNLQRLIAMARAQGMVPVVTNCYTRNDYTPTDYAFIKQMNLLLHSWAVPSVNLLGAVDDGAGHWASGYWDDALHPNDLGHAELASAIVPSLFDALRAGKARPHKVATSFVQLGHPRGTVTGGTGLLVRPDALHAFTQVVSFRTAGAGEVLGMQDVSAEKGSVTIEPNGTLAYHSPRKGILTGRRRVNDNRWHQLILTHYYAAGQTVLYLDGAEVGRRAEKLLTRHFRLGGGRAPQKAQYRNWLLYRAGMNREEVQVLAADSLPQSSLEVYAPLDGRHRGQSPDSLVNLAQSTEKLWKLPAQVLK
jgi:lysophospholipase L1-like esterase